MKLMRGLVLVALLVAVAATVVGWRRVEQVIALLLDVTFDQIEQMAAGDQ